MENNKLTIKTLIGKLQASKYIKFIYYYPTRFVTQSLRAIFYSPFYGMFATLLVVITGISGSLYSKEIKLSISNSYDYIVSLFIKNFDASQHALPGNVVANTFWILLLLVSLMYYFKHRHERNQQNQLAVQTLTAIKQNDRLQDIIRTLPPKRFLQKFATIYDASHAAAWMPFDPGLEASLREKIELIDHAIRVILNSVGKLVAIFVEDDKTSDRYFAVNVMLFHNISDFDDKQLERMREHILFLDDNADIKKNYGLLELIYNYSTSTKTETPEPDTELREFYLPIPDPAFSDELSTDDNKKLPRYLPGAPEAFVQKKLSTTEDTHELASWCKKADFTPSVCDKVKRYFESKEAQNVRSFASLPLMESIKSLDDDSNELCPIGVLNIHSNKPGLIGAEEPSTLFFLLMQPFLCLIYDLIMMKDQHIKKLENDHFNDE